MKKLLVYLFLFIIAIVLVGFGYISIDSKIGGVCISVGASIMSTILINTITERWLGDPLYTIMQNMKGIGNKLNDSVNILTMSKSTGLVGIWNKRVDLETKDWISYIEQTEGDIKILCYAMSFLPEHPNFKKVISNKISKGYAIRILFGDPDGSYIHARTLEENTEGSISERIKASVARIQSISDDIEIRYFNAPLYASIYEFGSRMFVTPQLFGTRGAAAPLVMLEKTEEGLFSSYDEYFENVWTNASKQNNTSN